ncbi:hypothetical protein GQ44DRAFT_702314 [Phaeosphaeriaceae sp. PMI808]|nr:hypothetical protein GQ44DRAFT_702314 [Phaeosphaeriaceae sp. PMI808]
MFQRVMPRPRPGSNRAHLSWGKRCHVCPTSAGCVIKEETSFSTLAAQSQLLFISLHLKPPTYPFKMSYDSNQNFSTHGAMPSFSTEAFSLAIPNDQNQEGGFLDLLAMGAPEAAGIAPEKRQTTSRLMKQGCASVDILEHQATDAGLDTGSQGQHSEILTDWNFALQTSFMDTFLDTPFHLEGHIKE